MANRPFAIDIVFPQTEIGTDPIEIRDFAQGVEALGFRALVAYDHVIGADLSHRPDWNMPYHLDTEFHEPLTLFAYLAGQTKTLVLMTGVVILPQRQTVLFAKQAAAVDIFSGGRLRLGVGIGWNKIEYDALGVPFDGRGGIIDEQIPLLRRLWTERSLSDDGRFHHIEEAGIFPLPVQRPIPLWVGGSTAPPMKRAARLGDGWFPYLPAASAAETVGKFREAVRAEGRDPDGVPIENVIFLAPFGRPRRALDDVAEDTVAWKEAGAQGVCIDTMKMGLRGADQHLGLARDLAQRLDPQRN